ncbi:membrane protein [Rhizobium sp. NBRC 114257]|uniref:Membrane protein n=2 Tax=Rhizobium/Agrobacterium group TaxID=227290 RepID=A0ABQ0ZER3_9HYPH|nr:membrane protein [Rhizobium dioscoreae]GLU85210.1 membrane protein [Rhizobium sp. NBRC 114257]
MVVVGFLAGILAACQTSQEGLKPIPGSITYRGQPSQRLQKSPVGSIVPHIFTDQWGERVRETYILQPDRSLKLVDRVYLDSPFD